MRDRTRTTVRTVYICYCGLRTENVIIVFAIVHSYHPSHVRSQDIHRYSSRYLGTSDLKTLLYLPLRAYMTHFGNRNTQSDTLGFARQYPYWPVRPYDAFRDTHPDTLGFYMCPTRSTTRFPADYASFWRYYIFIILRCIQCTVVCAIQYCTSTVLYTVSVLYCLTVSTVWLYCSYYYA